MSIQDDLAEINNLLMDLGKDYSTKVSKESEINLKIADLRQQLAILRDERFKIDTKLKAAQKNKESLERKRKLEEEAAAVEADMAQKRAEIEELIKDASWRNDAFDWQIDGAARLPARAILADKRGLGKTLSSLIWRKIQKSKKTLICLRKEVASDFIKEIYIREPGLFVYPLLGATPEQRNIAAMLLRGQEEFIVVTNIESWRRNVDKTVEDLLKIPYDTVILDEAHHIKNSSTGTAQGFFRIADAIPNVLELTGTPIKNKPQELFSLLHALYPDKFPRESLFLYDYCYQVGQNRWAFTHSGLTKLVQQIKHFYLARTPDDVGHKIPPPQVIEYKLDFEGYDLQKQAYNVMKNRSLAELSTGKVLPVVSQLALMTRLAQMVSWPAGIVFDIKDPWSGEVIEKLKFDVEQSVKADWAEDLIKELVEEEQRLILFSRFKPVLYELQRRLKLLDIPVAVITGDEKISREEVFNDFDLKTARKNPKYKVLLATYQTVGESANLNAARHMILFDRFWNPGNEDQAIGRIDRINSLDQATVHVPRVDGTIDDYMADLIDEKRNLVGTFKTAADVQAGFIDNLKKSV